MEWYKTLNINLRINLKAMAVIITGVPWNLLIVLYGFKGTVDIIHEKLIQEGFDV